MVRRRKQPGRSSKLLWLIGSLVVTFAATLIVGLVMTDTVVRWVFLHRLQSDVTEVRREGMVYVCRRAATDGDLRDELSDMLREADDPMLRATIIESLRCAGVWGPDFGEVWLEHLHRLADDEAVSTRITIALTLARTAMDGHAVVDHPLARKVMHQLLEDEESIVRFHAVRAAGAMGDFDAVAEHAHDDIRGPGWPAQMILHVARGRPFDFQSELGVGFDAYAQRDVEDEPWDQWLAIGPTDVPQQRLLWWRAILGAPLNEARTERLAALAQSAGPADDAIAAAAVSRVADHLPQPTWSDDEGRFWRELAHFESLEPRSTEIAFTADMPGLARVAAVRAARDVHEIDLLAMFDTEAPSVRRLAVLTAYDRLPADQARQLASRLSHTFVDSSRMAGALLAGMVGDVDLLERRLEREQVWTVKQYLRLGQMMAGQPVSLDTTALMARQDMDDLDVLWAMLHAGRTKAALDQLLDPLAGSSARLRRQLDQQRFWPVLKRYLPTEAIEHAPFWVWADPTLQGFQCDVLRTWYLINAREME